MPIILAQILRVGIQILAGVGLGNLIDKVAADKLPAVAGVIPKDFNPLSRGFNIVRFLVFIVTLAAAGFIVTMIGKKFKIKLLK